MSSPIYTSMQHAARLSKQGVGLDGDETRQAGIYMLVATDDSAGIGLSHFLRGPCA